MAIMCWCAFQKLLTLKLIVTMEHIALNQLFLTSLTSLVYAPQIRLQYSRSQLREIVSAISIGLSEVGSEVILVENGTQPFRPPLP